MISRKLIISLVLFSIILCIGSYYLSEFIFTKDKVESHMSASPQDAKITINGKSLQSNKLYLQPGNYMISATKDGYFEYRKIYEVNAENNQIDISLTQKPERTIKSMVYSNDYEKVLNQYPIVKNLPYDSFLIKISYSPSSTLNSFAIDIAAYEGYRQIAIDKINGWGYQPSDYNINFINYENPFAI